MAKTDNLKDFMTDLADAIREKTGTTEPINPQDFSQNILDIKTGVAAVESNDVDFLDYDGTILYSYSKDDFLALTELPPCPTREGLICQEWNWELEAAKTQVTECGKCDIGATYITDDGKTRLYISIVSPLRMTIPLNLMVGSPVIVDWGDGSEPQKYQQYMTHKYSQVGDYCITLEAEEGETYSLGLNQGGGLFGAEGTEKAYTCMVMLKRVEIGANVTQIYTRTFSSHYQIESITIPNNVATIGSYAFWACGLLKCVIFPKAITIIDSNCFEGSDLMRVSLPQGVTNVRSGAFKTCSSLKRITLPFSSGTSDDCFRSCKSLTEVYIKGGSVPSYRNAYNFSLTQIDLPNNVGVIGNYAFYQDNSLLSITFPPSVHQINMYAFYQCMAMVFYDFSQHTAVPTLNSGNAFGSIPASCKIIVPDALYDEWIAATNWSGKASNIIKKSEWDAQNA